MSEEKEIAYNLARPLVGVSEAIMLDSNLYFNSVAEVKTPERKAIILQNIQTLQNSLVELKGLLG